MLVYCSNCTHYKRGGCKSPNNEVVVPSFDKPSVSYALMPTDINTNNSCGWYKSNGERERDIRWHRDRREEWKGFIILQIILLILLFGGILEGLQ